MDKTSVETSLRALFDAPLKDDEKRKIIFWKDEDRAFEAIVDQFSMEQVKVLKLTGSNNFYAKKLLLKDDTLSNYLVYDPISFDNIKEDWLYDIKCYSETFSADYLSIRMKSLGMEDSLQMRKTVKIYDKFFQNKEREEKLRRFGSKYSTSQQLHIDIMAVLAGSKENTADGIIRAVLSAGLSEENNTALENIARYGNIDAMRRMVASYTGFAYGEDSTLRELAAHILLTACSVTVKENLLRGLEPYISSAHSQACYSLINEWLYSNEDRALYEIARQIEEDCHLENRFQKAETADFLDVECFPCINEIILSRFMSEIAEQIIKADEIIKVIEKRRTLKWYDEMRNYFDGILQIANMQKFKLENMTEYHIADYKDFWNGYTGNFYRMDSFYRKFHVAFGESLKNSSTKLGDLFKSTADYAESLYKNWFLENFGTKWMNLVRDSLEKKFILDGIEQQLDFYDHQVMPLAETGRTYIIISDALRYEVAAELAKQLQAETRGKVTISAMQAALPSITKVGMAALLPHKKLQMNEDLSVLCDGLHTNGTANREIILKSADSANTAVAYKPFLAMKKDEKRELVSGKKIVYIYHNRIDATGDKADTEDQVFDACEDAISELKNLVRIITGELSGVNILITADHGFLYTYKPLVESEKAEKDYVYGQIKEHGHRYMIAEQGSRGSHLISISMEPMETSDVLLAVPNQIRMKKQGGGMNYVHGGISLQEMAVPVITYKNIRAGSKLAVESVPVSIKLLSQSRKISNSIFSLDFYQEQPVGGKVTSAEYDIFLCDTKGRAVSDHQTMIADRSNENSEDRTSRLRFNLKNLEFDKQESYYLTIAEKNSEKASEQIEFSIDIAFANEFDF